MKKKLISIFAAAAAMIFLSTGGFSQSAFDQHGFGSRAYLIQSALEVGKSTKGLWDIPGTPKKTDGNLKGSKWLQMNVWEREKGDPEDRVFRFSAAQGSSAGKYFIKVGRSGYWGVNAVDMTNKIEARSRADIFNLVHKGNGRWKIYYKDKYVVCLEKMDASNGVKLVIKPDHNGLDTEWVFFDTHTNKSFVPREVRAPEERAVYKGTLDVAISTKKPGTQYFTMADGAKFVSENSGNKLQAYLNDMDTTSDQWVAIMNIVDAVKTNKDVAARREMYKAMSESEVKKGSNFAENMLQGQFVKKINEAARKENDAVARRYIEILAGKF